jgi:hypothetical protein
MKFSGRTSKLIAMSGRNYLERKKLRDKNSLQLTSMKG